MNGEWFLRKGCYSSITKDPFPMHSPKTQATQTLAVLWAKHLMLDSCCGLTFQLFLPCLPNAYSSVKLPFKYHILCELSSCIISSLRILHMLLLYNCNVLSYLFSAIYFPSQLGASWGQSILPPVQCLAYCGNKCSVDTG